jgi:undecaprenyl-diphosphatase
LRRAGGPAREARSESDKRFRLSATQAKFAACSPERRTFVDFISLLRAALLGIIQGLTEFLPISSTAHLLISQRLLGYGDEGSAFTVMIQLGSILAVMWLYRQRIVDVVTGLPTRAEARRFALMLFLAFLPAVPVGLYGKDFVTGALHTSMTVIAAAFVLGGLAMLAIERWRPTPSVTDAGETPIGRAIGVGVFQALALIPGVSRSGSTIFGGLILGLDRRAAAEFSFFLAMPTMTAAFIVEFLDVKDTIAPDRIAEISVGFLFAFLSALVVVRPFLNFVTRVGFAPFAWYRIALGLVMFAAMALGWK